MATKTETTRRIKREASSPKSALLQLARRIEADGLAREAESLRNIICRLEDWQNR